MSAQTVAQTPRPSVTHKGIRLKRGMDFEDWIQVGRQLAATQNGVQWAFGDWFFYGEWEYGSKYEEAVELTGLARSTLADLKYVCGRFEMSRRREKLSLSHHREVAPMALSEQDRWLDTAETNGWTREQLRSSIAGERQADRKSVV